MSYFEESEEEPDVEVEDWKEDEDDIPYEIDDTQMMAQRILPGQEDRQHWQQEMAGGGLMATTAEGSFGKILRKRAMATRSDDERFRDNVIKVAREASISYSDRDSVLRLIPVIPDIRYKSATGMLFGFMARNLIGKKLSRIQEIEWEKIMDMVKSVKAKNLRIDPLDIVRYSKLIQRIMM